MTSSAEKNARNRLYPFVNERIERILAMPSAGAQKALLAELRRGVGKEPGELPALWGILLEDFPPEWMPARGAASREEWAVYLALTLFALHQQGLDPRTEPMHRKDMPLGKAVRGLVPSGDMEAQERVLRRFRQLAIAASVQGVAHHLRAMVQMLRGEKIALDYAALARDLYWYQWPEFTAKVRLRWAEDFYRIERVGQTD